MKKKTWIIAGAVAVVVLGGAGVAVAATDPFDSDDRLSGQELENASAAALEAVGEGTVSEAERSNDLDHDYSVEVRLDNGGDVDVELDDSFEVVRIDGVVPGSGSSTGTGSSDDASAAPGARVDDDTPITAEERASAEAAALAEVGSGTVTDLDRSDESDHAWEVEVTVADGTDLDVELADDFSVVRVDGDN
jgi:uncharacterized membrane protein YkoI